MSLTSNRGRFSGFLEGIGKNFAKVGLSPNQWTLISLIPVIIAVYALMQGLFLVAGLLFILSSFIDIVDGSVARHLGKASKKGAYIDTIVDRYVEGIIIFGILLVGLPAFLLPSYVWIFLVIFGSIMTSYSKAAAKEKEIIGAGSELKGRFIARAERLLILFAGIIAASINPIFLTYVLAILAVLANISALDAIRIALKA